MSTPANARFTQHWQECIVLFNSKLYKMKITPFLEDCLTYLRANFSGKKFKKTDVWVHIRRADYNLARLEKAGFLKSEVVYEDTWLIRYYSLVE